MATRRYMTNLGETDVSVTEAIGSATATKNVEATIDFAVVTSKEDALLALSRIKRHIIQGNWPPA
jgi:hypothetical protein